MFENFDEKYLSVTKFFEKIISGDKKSVPNSVILQGPDIIAQYYFAMLLARGANCTGDKKQTCECQNCRWIKANEHPEVMTFSKINSKPENDDAKTVISVKQTDIIKDKLVISSDYHRFFIFCDAENRAYSESEKEKINYFSFLNQSLPEAEKEQWVPSGLSEKCFSDIVANALLKAIEEPPENITFIFLTENVENIISTIVSRSQVFYIPGNSRQDNDYKFLNQILADYPNIDRKKAVKISDYLLNYSKEQGQSVAEIVLSVQTYLKELLKNNAKNPIIKKIIFDDLEKLQQAYIMSKSSFKEQVITDEIGYILTK